MAKHITRWRPDTCQCVIDLEWDDTDPEAMRQHTPVKAERCLAHHTVAAAHQALLDVVLVENRHKNEVQRHLVEALSEPDVVVDEQGRRRLARETRFEYDSERTLKIKLLDDNPAYRANVEAALNARAFTRAVEIN